MNTYVSKMVRKYKNRGLLIDTNIALLYVIGSLDISQIRSYGRTAHYSEDDFDRVWRFVEYFSIRITTPHLLTEISNLLGNSPERHGMLRGVIAQMKETYTNSRTLSQYESFLKIGLADTAIITAAKKPYLVLTDDGPLQQFLLGKGVDLVSLDQIRLV